MVGQPRVPGNWHDTYAPCPYQSKLVTVTDAPGQDDNDPLAGPRKHVPARPSPPRGDKLEEKNAENAQLEKRVADLEKRVAELERRLGVVKRPHGDIRPHGDMGPGGPGFRP